MGLLHSLKRNRYNLACSRCLRQPLGLAAQVINNQIQEIKRVRRRGTFCSVCCNTGTVPIPLGELSDSYT